MEVLLLGERDCCTLSREMRDDDGRRPGEEVESSRGRSPEAVLVAALRIEEVVEAGH